MFQDDEAPAALVERERRLLPHVAVLPDPSGISAADLRDALGPSRIAELVAIMGSPVPEIGPLSTQGSPPDSCLSTLVTRGAGNAELHDGYFAVSRAAPTDVAAHLESVVFAAAALKADSLENGTEQTRSTVETIHATLSLVFSRLTGSAPNPAALPWTKAWSAGPVTAAIRRWLRGHQIFLVLIQGMLCAVAKLMDATDTHQRRACLDDMVELLRGAAASLQLTGSFDWPIYDHVIRPSMAPPFVPAGFSGLFSSDHRLLVQRLREARPLFSSAKRELSLSHAALVEAFSALYDRHIAVCGKFVGVNRASLLMGQADECDAIEQLERFKCQRLRSLRG